jgi:hypothetical protein
MINISIDKEMANITKEMLAGFPKEADKVILHALNRTLDNVRANMVRKTRDIYTVKSTTVRKTIKIRKATKEGEIIHANVISRGGANPVNTAFRVSPRTVNGKRRTPIKLSIKKNSEYDLDRAFIAQRHGYHHVFERDGKPRLPISKVFGPSVPQMIQNQEVEAFVTKEAQKTIEKRILHEINRYLDGAR